MSQPQSVLQTALQRIMTRLVMRSQALRRAYSLLVGATLFVGTPASATSQATQAPPPAGGATIADRLMRISNDLAAGGQRADEDIKEATAVLAIDPKIAEAHMLLGMAYRAKGSPELLGEAKAELQQALEIKPELVVARYFLAQTYFDLGRLERARDELTTGLKQVPNEPQMLLLLGETERRLANPKRAIEVLRQAIQVAPSLPQARYYLGEALLDAGQSAEGIAVLEDLVKSGIDVPDLWITLGSAYVDANRLDEGIAALERGTKVALPDAEARVVLARAYRLKGNLARAEEELSLALPSAAAMQPTISYQNFQRDLQLELGLLRMKQSAWPEAAKAFEQAISIDPASGPAHRALAEVLFRQGQYKKSLEHANTAQKLGAPLADDLRKQLDAKIRGGGHQGGDE